MDNMTYEQAITRLEEIVSLLEKSDISIDESLKLFEEGTRLTSFCKDKLENAKAKITEIKKDQANVFN